MENRLEAAIKIVAENWTIELNRAKHTNIRQNPFDDKSILRRPKNQIIFYCCLCRFVSFYCSIWLVCVCARIL